jgi:hypothetical protein
MKLVRCVDISFFLTFAKDKTEYHDEAVAYVWPLFGALGHHC